MIFYDHTSTFYDDINTGVQRVVKQLGNNLMAEIPDGFAPVVFVRDTFHQCAVDSARPSGQLFRRFVRELDLAPVNAIRRLVRNNELVHRVKTRLWQVLVTPRGLGPLAEMKKGDWYLTADAIWHRPAILAQLQELRSAGVRTAVVHYDLIPVIYPQWCDRMLREKFAQYAEALASFDVVFCISEFVKEEFVQFCGRRGYRLPEAVVTVTLGYEIARNLPSDQEKVPWRTDRPFALCVGTLDPRKNHRTLLDAFDILWARSMDLSLVIVGKPGVRSEEILSRIRRHPLSDRQLFYLPNCGDDELEALYHRCAFTILPSIFEGFGLPLVESMGRGKPCVCSDIPVFRETAGRFGVYFNPGDPRSLVSQIETLYSDPDRLASLTRLIGSAYSPPSWKECAHMVLQTLGYKQTAPR